jgi:RNA polymerase sigma-70 factor (ECF subfamily)
MSETDDDLVRRVAAGETAAAGVFVRRHLPRVTRLAQRMLGDAHEAEDVAQDAFMRAWKHAPQWIPGKAKFATWLHRVTLNLCYDRLRKRRETPHADAGLELADPAPGASEAWLTRQRSAHVRAALDRLPPRQRAAIALCHYEEMAQTEAAAALGVSVDALESLLARARRALRADLAAIAEDLLGSEHHHG